MNHKVVFIESIIKRVKGKVFSDWHRILRKKAVRSVMEGTEISARAGQTYRHVKRKVLNRGIFLILILRIYLVMFNE